MGNEKEVRAALLSPRQHNFPWSSCQRLAEKIGKAEDGGPVMSRGSERLLFCRANVAICSDSTGLLQPVFRAPRPLVPLPGVLFPFSREDRARSLSASLCHFRHCQQLGWDLPWLGKGQESMAGIAQGLLRISLLSSPC